MENKEIMVNDEVMDVTEEIATAESGNGLKVVAGIGLAALVGFGLYKLGKHIYAKAKAKKEQQLAEEDYSDVVEADVDEIA